MKISSEFDLAMSAGLRQALREGTRLSGHPARLGIEQAVEKASRRVCTRSSVFLNAVGLRACYPVLSQTIRRR
jgi:hypothetical protein